MPSVLNLLLVDDHALFREGVESIVSIRLPDAWLRCAEGAYAAEVALDESLADLVLLDLDLGRDSGLELLQRWRIRWPDLRIVMLSATPDPRLMLRCIEQGARGFIPKSSNGALLVGAIDLVLAGGTYIPPELLPTSAALASWAAFAASPTPAQTEVEAAAAGQTLTPRQLEVLTLLASGCSNKDIARKLTMADGTVRAHINALFRTLEVSNRTQAVIRAQQLRCFPGDRAS